jgi:hypothetical protein
MTHQRRSSLGIFRVNIKALIDIYYLFYVGAKETILPSEKIIIDLLKSLKMILKTLIIC